VEEGSEDMLMAYTSLVQLTTDFTTTVRPFAKVRLVSSALHARTQRPDSLVTLCSLSCAQTIISELNFPAAQKTIKPLSTCGTSLDHQRQHITCARASMNVQRGVAWWC
jgi:hypothetical protein